MKFNKSKKFFAGLMASLFVSGIGFNAKAIRTLEEVHELAANTFNAHPNLIDVLDPANTLGFKNTGAINSEQASLLLDNHRGLLVPQYTDAHKRKFLRALTRLSIWAGDDVDLLKPVIMLHIFRYAVANTDTLWSYRDSPVAPPKPKQILQRSVTQNGTTWFETLDRIEVSELCGYAGGTELTCPLL